METDNTTDAIEDTHTAIDALQSSDPADAPDIAEGIASSLQRELDSEEPTGTTHAEPPL